MVPNNRATLPYCSMEIFLTGLLSSTLDSGIEVRQEINVCIGSLIHFYINLGIGVIS